jgi:tetratricopeptide (TPR) repeat protein
MIPENPYSRRLNSVIGRNKEKNKIIQAIKGDGEQIIFLEGMAGIGKTSLLEFAEKIAKEYQAICLPIIDFYDTEMHAHPAVEAAILSALAPGKEQFAEYWDFREQLVPGGKTLKEHQDKLWGLFLKGYTSLTAQKRVVLRFDTAERLEYERDSQDVLDDCEVLTQDAPSWEWLLRRIGELQNTVILIAARPTPAGGLKQRLLEAHKERVAVLNIEGFTFAETKSYFQKTDIGSQVAGDSPEMVRKIHLLTEGRPILIALALDWLERGMWERHIHPITLDELKILQKAAEKEERAGMKGQAWQKWNEIQRSFEIALVEQIRGLDHTGLDVAVKYTALARKGCNIGLLSRLMDISADEAEKVVKRLLDLSFVKSPRGARQLFFLHDEMYDLVERNIWLVDWPDYAEQARLDRRIVEWYTEQIESLNEQIKVAPDRRVWSDLRRNQQLLQSECLYYQFDEDPRLGYREYSHLDEQAIGSRDHEWDAWLRNEALWFMTHRAWRHGKSTAPVGIQYPRRDPAWMKDGKVEHNPAIDFDCRRRWIFRYIAQNEPAKAARIAENLLQKSKVSPHPDQPELYEGSVQIALATAQAYMGGKYVEAAVRNFNEGIQALESVNAEHREPWLYPFLLGTAYLYKGLAARGSLRLKDAVQAYCQAIFRYYRPIDYKAGLAEAMNNLAYIYARQGLLHEGLDSCQKGLNIRKELGDDYYIGLSLNTKGIIHERLNRPVTAIKNSQEALELFRKINDERGIILAEINLGRSYRRKARSVEWGQEDEDFETGKGYLENAIHQQEQIGASADMFYRIEAHNELGCLYRDWVATLESRGIKDNLRSSQLLESAEDNLLKVIRLTTQDGEAVERHAVQYVDSLDDLSRVYYWRARLGLPVGSWAKQHEINTPIKAMKTLLDEAIHLAEDHLKEWEEEDFILGKLRLQYARLTKEEASQGMREALLKETARQYAISAALLERYSYDAPELRKTVQDACNWLSGLEPDEAEKRIEQMQSALQTDGLKSRRMKEWINSVVFPILGVIWLDGNEEAA